MLCSAVTIVQQMEKAHNHLGQAKWIFLREPPTRRYAKAIDWPYKLILKSINDHNSIFRKIISETNKVSKWPLRESLKKRMGSFRHCSRSGGRPLHTR